MNTEKNLHELPEPHRERRGHDFWPSRPVLDAIPRLYGTDGKGVRAAIVHLHYFTPGCDWWVTELDPREALAFGFCRFAAHPQGAEWGYIDLGELADVYLEPLVVVERDLFWEPGPAGSVIPDLG